MLFFTGIILIFVLSSFAYYLGQKRSFAAAKKAGGMRKLHSRPPYYGALTAIWAGIPAILVFGFWLSFETSIITKLVVTELPAEIACQLAKNISKNTMREIVFCGV